MGEHEHPNAEDQARVDVADLTEQITAIVAVPEPVDWLEVAMKANRISGIALRLVPELRARDDLGGGRR